MRGHQIFHNAFKKKVPAASKYEEVHFVDTEKPVWNYSRFQRGRYRQFSKWHSLPCLYDLFGAHEVEVLEHRDIILPCGRPMPRLFRSSAISTTGIPRHIPCLSGWKIGHLGRVYSTSCRKAKCTNIIFMDTRA